MNLKLAFSGILFLHYNCLAPTFKNNFQNIDNQKKGGLEGHFIFLRQKLASRLHIKKKNSKIKNLKNS